MNDKSFMQIQELNNLILKLAQEVNDKNYLDIITFLQKNKYDVNNKLIDQIIKEQDEKKKELLIEQMNNDNTVDYNASGYVAQLFSIFKNIKDFCIIESRKSECMLCGKNSLDNNLDNKPFIYIALEDLNEKHIFNILLKKYKEIYTYDYDCRKGS